ncbi:MAG: hypothetical protein Q4E38_00280 [Eubacteriales bacterium]|nr:hypothetical protein [Eubacteriales bacterium]
MKKKRQKLIALAAALALILSLGASAWADDSYTNTADGEHAITADGEQASYSNITVSKTGDASGDEADFYGANAAIFATNGATLDLTHITVDTDGTHANAVFSYGAGTTVNIADSTIETRGNCSGGLMTTGGGTMKATDLTVHTTGNSSAAIRSDRGGGTVIVTGGSYSTEGVGSPAVYSTADITVNSAELTSSASQGVVIEGKNSVTLNDVTLTANNVSKNSDKSAWYQAVMIYQSMSGDAAAGLASFTMDGGRLLNQNGDIFFVNNTAAEITLRAVEIENTDEEGVFLRAAAAGWGREGSNGGHVTLRAAAQSIDGDMLVDEVSTLNLYLTENSSFTGAINPDGAAGEVYVEIEDGSVWTLTADSYISGLTCPAGAVVLNGYTLSVGGIVYTEGSASEGEPVAVESSTSESGMGEPPEGFGGEHPEGMGEPPEGFGGERPEGMGEPPQGGPGGEPPAKP